MNIYSNRQACSRDIAQKFAKHLLLKFVMNCGHWGESTGINAKYAIKLMPIYRQGFFKTINSPETQYPLSFILANVHLCIYNNWQRMQNSKFLQEDGLKVTNDREIYQPGSPRLVSMQKYTN